MKKTFLSIAAIMIIAGATLAVTMTTQSRQTPVSDLIKANIEALLDPESDGPGLNEITCYSALRISPKDPETYEPVWQVTDCNGCKSAQCFEFQNSGTCKKKSNNGLIICNF